MTRVPVIFDENSDDKEFLNRSTADQLYINLNEPYSTNLNMNGNKIINMSEPTDGRDGVNKQYLQQLLNSKIDKNSNINMGNNKITNLADGVSDHEAVNVKQLRAIKNEIEADFPIKVKLKTVEGTVAELHNSNTEQLLFSDNFIHAIIIKFELQCILLDEQTFEQWVNITDIRISGNFSKRVMVQNKSFILTKGVVINTINVIFTKRYKLTYLYFI
jgi:hypothetical protein